MHGRTGSMNGVTGFNMDSAPVVGLGKERIPAQPAYLADVGNLGIGSASRVNSDGRSRLPGMEERIRCALVYLCSCAVIEPDKESGTDLPLGAWASLFMCPVYKRICLVYIRICLNACRACPESRTCCDFRP